MGRKYFIANGKSKKLATNVMRSSGKASFALNCFIRMYAEWAKSYVVDPDTGKVVALGGGTPSPAEAWAPVHREGVEGGVWRPSDDASADKLREEFDSLPTGKSARDVGRAIYNSEVSVGACYVGRNLYLDIDDSLDLPTPPGAIPVSESEMKKYRRQVIRNERISKHSFESELRIKKMFWLACDNISETDDDLRDFFESNTDKELSDIFGIDFNSEKEVGVSRREQSEFRMSQIADVFNEMKIFGFIVQFATPVKKRIASNGEDSSYYYSWGHTRSKWVYAETLAEAMKGGRAWLRETNNREDKPDLNASAVVSTPEG